MRMSYNNYKPIIWSKHISRELERALVFAEDCNRQYEGEVSKAGDTVRILGVGKPTVKTFKGITDITLDDAEVVGDTSTSLLIDTTSTFNYVVGDIDKRQAEGSIMEALSTESTQALANEMDVAIAELANDKLAVKADKTDTQLTEANILNYIDTQLEKLYVNDVTPNSEIIMTVPPWFYMLLKQAYVKLDTDNSATLKNGKVGKYGNVQVKMSNNVAKNSAGHSMIQLKTKKAIAFANPMTHTEPYRPDNKFADCVKGFVLYGQKIVRPKEMIVMNCYK